MLDLGLLNYFGSEDPGNDFDILLGIKEVPSREIRRRNSLSSAS